MTAGHRSLVWLKGNAVSACHRAEPEFVNRLDMALVPGRSGQVRVLNDLSVLLISQRYQRIDISRFVSDLL